MTRYQCLFVNHAGEVFGSEFIEAESDTDAIETASTLFRNGIGNGFELWQGDRLVHARRGGG